MEFNISLNTENTHIRVKDIKRVLNTVLDEFKEDAILNFSDARYKYSVNGKSLEVENTEGEKVDIGPVNVKITINPKEEKDVEPLKVVKDPVYVPTPTIPWGEQSWNRPYGTINSTNTKYSDGSIISTRINNNDK